MGQIEMGQRLLHVDIEERRVRVAQLLLARYSLRQIAQVCGTSRMTAQRDVEAVRAEWLAHRMGSVEQIAADDLARLDRAEAAIWDQIEDGKLYAIDRLLAIMERRAKLLGLDVPTKVDLTLQLRERAVAEGLDPDEVVKAAQEIVKAGR